MYIKKKQKTKKENPRQTRAPEKREGGASFSWFFEIHDASHLGPHNRGRLSSLVVREVSITTWPQKGVYTLALPYPQLERLTTLHLSLSFFLFF